MASHHLLFSMALGMQVIVTSVYWTLLHRDVMANNKGHMGAMIYQCLAHSLPALACLYNLCVTDFIYYRGIDKLSVGLSVFYLLLNFTMTKITGNVTYFFLSWKDPTTSAFVCLLCVTIPLGFNHMLALGTEFIK